MSNFHISTLALAVLGLAMCTSQTNAKLIDKHSDTWVATDALGRSISTNDQAGSPRQGKFVGVFYFLWLGQHDKGGPYDVTKILQQDPDAMQKPNSPLWGPENTYHYWGEPLFGYYRGDDPWVLRKHAQMLSEAGVDTVIFDTSNTLTYPNVYLALCKEWEEVRKEGGNTPQIAFLPPFADPQGTVRKLYKDFYSKNLYSDLWFRWKGKPLMLAYDELFDKEPEIKNFFTFRPCQPDYFVGPTGPGQWGWLQKYPQKVFYDFANRPEEITVGVAQNAHDNVLSAMSEPNTFGRSWHDGKKDERPGAVNYGLNFAEQWERALKVDPEFVFVTGWNEWIAMRLSEFNGVKMPVMFVDQYSEEYSRDIEPMQGGHTDNYYYQMVDYIRKFKGVRKQPVAGAQKTIKIDGSFNDWKDVKPDYLDSVNDTVHRDFPGVADAGQYVNNTGRNDFVQMKVARDKKNIYFYAKTSQKITPYTDKNWMMLFINSDCDSKAGWEGYNFVVNRKVKDSSVTFLEQSVGGWNWKQKAEIHYKVSGCEMELSIPRAALGFADLKKPVKFDFKWADNMKKEGDIMEFTLNGDAAPDGRFAYRFKEK